jgi:hypothetical protein
MPTDSTKQKPEVLATVALVDVADRSRGRMPVRPSYFGLALRRGRRGRRGRRTAMATAVTAWATVPARTHARAEGTRHHRRTAGPTWTHTGWKWPTWEDEHPVGAFGTLRTKHAVVMVEGAIMPGDRCAGEENNRDDENRAGNNHHPRRSLVEP